uniref:Uncharacterized protein n=1 Tax=Peronospora matthiolae TaxID=2874970 RepID=A0AAV1VAD9_9STRA
MQLDAGLPRLRAQVAVAGVPAQVPDAKHARVLVMQETYRALVLSQRFTLQRARQPAVASFRSCSALDSSVAGIHHDCRVGSRVELLYATTEWEVGRRDTDGRSFIAWGRHRSDSAKAPAGRKSTLGATATM